jgi:hypothetical protein
MENNIKIIATSHEDFDFIKNAVHTLPDRILKQVKVAELVVRGASTIAVTLNPASIEESLFVPKDITSIEISNEFGMTIHSKNFRFFQQGKAHSMKITLI